LIVNNSEHFYDNRLRIFASTSASLHKLSIAANPKLTPYGIKAFFNNSEARLMELDISHNPALNDDCLLVAIRTCSETLTKINISR
jgi:hypothetical protein